MKNIQLLAKIWQLDRISRRNVLSYAISLLTPQQQVELLGYISEIE